MTAKTAPPPPRFEDIAANFGIKPDQLQTLLTHPKGEKILESLMNANANAQAAMGAAMNMQDAQKQLNMQGNPGLGGMSLAVGFQNAQQHGFVTNQSPVNAGRTPEQWREEALERMNPIAREKYEPVFKLLDITVRWTGGSFVEPSWAIQKATRAGHKYQQTWSAPAVDPGCSLAVWDAMVGELLDNIRKADGTYTDNSPAVTGK